MGCCIAYTQWDPLDGSSAPFAPATVAYFDAATGVFRLDGAANAHLWYSQIVSLLSPSQNALPEGKSNDKELVLQDDGNLVVYHGRTQTLFGITPMYDPREALWDRVTGNNARVCAVEFGAKIVGEINPSQETAAEIGVFCILKATAQDQKWFVQYPQHNILTSCPAKNPNLADSEHVFSQIRIAKSFLDQQTQINDQCQRAVEYGLVRTPVMRFSRLNNCRPGDTANGRCP